MIITRDFVTRENYWQIASLVTQKSLFTVSIPKLQGLHRWSFVMDKLLAEIAYPFLNFNGYTVEV